MQGMIALAFAFAVGLTFSGLGASALELATGRRLGFRPPFVIRGRFGRSLALTVLVGPFMLTNEAIAACRAGLVDPLALALCGIGAAIWATATGVVVVELALLASALLG